jgi:hypothetical protein
MLLDIYWNVLTMHVPINVKSPNNISEWQMGFNSVFKGLITFFFFISCRLWDNVEKCCRVGQAADDNKIQRMRFACWIPKATNTHTHTQYVILIAFPLQQWLQERASMLRYTYSYVQWLFCIFLFLRRETFLVIVIPGLFWQLDPAMLLPPFVFCPLPRTVTCFLA